MDAMILAQEKFDTCKFREKEMRVIEYKSSCSCPHAQLLEMKDWYCTKKDLFGVCPRICLKCDRYERLDTDSK